MCTCVKRIIFFFFSLFGIYFWENLTWYIAVQVYNIKLRIYINPWPFVVDVCLSFPILNFERHRFSRVFFAHVWIMSNDVSNFIVIDVCFGTAKHRNKTKQKHEPSSQWKYTRQKLKTVVYTIRRKIAKTKKKQKKMKTIRSLFVFVIQSPYVCIR